MKTDLGQIGRGVGCTVAAIVQVRPVSGSKCSKDLFRTMKKNWAFFAMLLPGVIVLIVNNYIPMFGVVTALKSTDFMATLFNSLIQSDWVGSNNFRFFFETPYAYQTTRNTILYNLAFIILDLIVPIFLAVLLNELQGKKTLKGLSEPYVSPIFSFLDCRGLSCILILQH